MSDIVGLGIAATAVYGPLALLVWWRGIYGTANIFCAVFGLAAIQPPPSRTELLEHKLEIAGHEPDCKLCGR